MNASVPVLPQGALHRESVLILLFLGMVFGSLFAGCSTPYGVVMARYREAPVCCRSFADFPYEDLRQGDSKSFDLNDKSPAFAFDTGKSYFKAFRLPPYAIPYRIVLRSYMLGDSVDSAYILCPQVIFLDEKFATVRSTDYRFLRLTKAGFFETAGETWGLMWKLEGEIEVAEANRNEKYMIIFTTDTLLAAKTSISTWRTVPIVLPGLVTAIPTHKEEVLVPHSPVGRISLSAGGEGK